MKNIFFILYIYIYMFIIIIIYFFFLTKQMHLPERNWVLTATPLYLDFTR